MTEHLNEKACDEASTAFWRVSGQCVIPKAIEAAIRAYLSALPVASDEEVAGLVESLHGFAEMPLEGESTDPLIECIQNVGHQAADAIASLLSRAQAAEAERDRERHRANLLDNEYTHAAEDANSLGAELTAARAEIDRIGKYLFRAQAALHMCNSVFVPGNDDANGRIAYFLAELDENFSSDKAE